MTEKNNKSEEEYEGTEGQDRKSYTDTQDRDNYVPDPKLEKEKEDLQTIAKPMLVVGDNAYPIEIIEEEVTGFWAFVTIPYDLKLATYGETAKEALDFLVSTFNLYMQGIEAYQFLKQQRESGGLILPNDNNKKIIVP